MQPQPFPEANRVLKAPPTMTEEECGELPVFTDGRECISCWKPTWQERLSILLFGKVWLFCATGHTQPPVALVATRTLFSPVKEPTEAT